MILDDPHGITSAMPQEVMDDAREGQYFVERVQAIRWELFGLLTDLDASEGLSEEAERLIPQAIDLLGAVVRVEAAYHDA